MAVQKRTLGAQTTTAPAGEKRPPAQYWANIGFLAPNPQTGEEMFIGTPLGIPLDGQDEPKRSANNPLTQAKCALAKQLIELAEQLEPGADVCLTDLVVQVRRVEAPQEGTAENNAMIAAMPNLRLAS